MAKSQVRTGAVLSYVNMAIGSLIPMFYTPVMLELLGQSEYGLYRLATSITSYLGLISFGIGSAVVRYLTKYRAEGDKEGEEGVFALFKVIFIIISAVALVAGLIIAFFIDAIYGNSLTEPGQIDEMRILVIILSASTALSFLCTPYNSVVTSHERFVFLQSINILLTIISPLLNLVVLYLGFKSIGMVTAFLFVNIIVRIVYSFYVKYSIKISPNYHNMPKRLIREILTFSFWVFISNIVNQLYNSTDTLIIGAIPKLATIGVAVYNIGVTFTTMMHNFSIGILSVLTPKVNMMVFSGKSNSELTDLMIRIGRLQCYIVTLVCSGFIVFGAEFINLWAGDGYQEAYWVALVTIIPSCIPLIQNVALNVIVAQNRHRFRSLMFLFIALINVVGTIICVNTYGIIGAAVVTGAANILGTGLIMNWYYWKRIGLEIPRFWKSTLKMFVIPTILCVLFFILKQFITIDKWIVMLVLIVIYSIIFIVLNWLFVMNDYEKDIFIGPIKRIGAKLKRGRNNEHN